MKDRTVRTRTVTVELDDDGILNVFPLPGITQGADDARENLEACRKLLGGRSGLVLVDLRTGGILDRGARTVYAEEAAEFTLAQAMLVDSAFARITANLFIRVASPRQITRMFTDKAEAVRWLKEYGA